MAAVTSGIRTTKGFFFIFSLLTLICFTSSLIDKKQLANLKKSHQKIKDQLNRLKNQDIPASVTSSDMLEDYINLMDPTIAMLKNYKEDDEDDLFPQWEKLLEKTKGFLQKTKTYVDTKNDEIDVKIGDLEQKLQQTETLIKFLEEHQAEL